MVVSTHFPDRYHKQVLCESIGPGGQAALRGSRVLLVGCGALGSVTADTLVRAGIGTLRIVDRDFVDSSNLQRQVLYQEQDVLDRLPKAVAAARHLQRVNSEVILEPYVQDLAPDSIHRLGHDVDLIIDGTDNFETRLLINDFSLEYRIPWINGACVATHGQVMTILPGRTACYRCLVADLPEPGSMETCDTVGVLAPAVHVVASLQVVEAFKVLTGKLDEIEPVLTVIDVWEGSLRRLRLDRLADRSDCPACGRGARDFLRGERGVRGSILCGRNAVQISPPTAQISLEELADRLLAVGEVQRNPYLLRVQLRDCAHEITVFKDGRAIVHGTQDPGVARSLYARYIGS